MIKFTSDHYSRGGRAVRHVMKTTGSGEGLAPYLRSDRMFRPHLAKGRTLRVPHSWKTASGFWNDSGPTARSTLSWQVIPLIFLHQTYGWLNQEGSFGSPVQIAISLMKIGLRVAYAPDLLLLCSRRCSNSWDSISCPVASAQNSSPYTLCSTQAFNDVIRKAPGIPSTLEAPGPWLRFSLDFSNRIWLNFLGSSEIFIGVTQKTVIVIKAENTRLKMVCC